MENFEQPSIDSVLSTSTIDLALVRSALDVHFQNNTNRIKRKSYMSSPKTPDTPSIYDALGSHPPTRSGVGFQATKIRPQAALLVIPSSRQASPRLANNEHGSFLDTQLYTYSDSALYTPTEASSSPLLPSPVSLPSLMYSPATPPTPRSPLLPCFPEVSVSLYKNLPFSPTLPSFPDCPFQYYHDNIPPSKARAKLRLSMESYITAPSSPASPIEIVVTDSSTADIVEEMVREDRERLKNSQTQSDTSIFDFDSDVEDEDDDAGSYSEGGSQNEYNRFSRARSGSDTSVETQIKVSPSPSPSSPSSPFIWPVSSLPPRTTNIYHYQSAHSPTSPTSPSSSASQMMFPLSAVSPSHIINQTNNAHTWQRNMTLEAQMRDLERTYAMLRAQHHHQQQQQQQQRNQQLKPQYIPTDTRLSSPILPPPSPLSIQIPLPRHYSSPANPLTQPGGLRLKV